MAGPSAEKEESEALYIHNAASSEPLITVIFGTRTLQFFNEKIGFFKKTPVARPTGLKGHTGVTEIGGTTIESESTFTGAIGSTTYTVTDIVRALKELELIAE